MSTKGSVEKQSSKGLGGGGNTGTYAKNRLHQPPNIFGKSGQPDNQSTSRPKGST